MSNHLHAILQREKGICRIGSPKDWLRNELIEEYTKEGYMLPWAESKADLDLEVYRQEQIAKLTPLREIGD